VHKLLKKSSLAEQYKLKQEDRKMSKRFLFMVLFVFFSLFLMCESLKLTEKEAMDLIRKENGLPKPATISIKFKPGINNGLCSEFVRLVDEGYMEVDDYEMKCLRKGELKNKIIESGLLRGSAILFSNPKITIKGRTLIEYASFEGSGEVHFSPYTLMYDVKKINEILIDSDNKIALVSYLCEYTPTDYFYILRDIDKDLIENSPCSFGRTDECFRNGFRRTTHEITLKKWDKGWRVF